MTKEYIEWLNSKGVEYKVLSEGILENYGIAKEFCKGTDKIIIIGGDGSINIAVNATSELDIPYGLIPCGTGNDLARGLHLLNLSNEEVFEKATYGELADVDVWKANGKVQFVLTLTFGIPAEVNDIHIYGDEKKRKKEITDKTLNYKPRKYRIESDDETIEGEMMLVSLMNVPTIGKGLMFCRKAKYGDGILDMVCVKKCGKVRLLFDLVAMKNEGLSTQSNASNMLKSHYEITTDKVEICMIDGEVYHFDHVTVDFHKKIKISI